MSSIPPRDNRGMPPLSSDNLSSLSLIALPVKGVLRTRLSPLSGIVPAAFFCYRRHHWQRQSTDDVSGTQVTTLNKASLQSTEDTSTQVITLNKASVQFTDDTNTQVTTRNKASLQTAEDTSTQVTTLNKASLYTVHSR